MANIWSGIPAEPLDPNSPARRARAEQLSNFRPAVPVAAIMQEPGARFVVAGDMMSMMKWAKAHTAPARWQSFRNGVSDPDYIAMETATIHGMVDMWREPQADELGVFTREHVLLCGMFGIDYFAMYAALVAPHHHMDEWSRENFPAFELEDILVSGGEPTLFTNRLRLLLWAVLFRTMRAAVQKILELSFRGGHPNTLMFLPTELPAKMYAALMAYPESAQRAEFIRVLVRDDRLGPFVMTHVSATTRDAPRPMSRALVAVVVAAMFRLIGADTLVAPRLRPAELAALLPAPAARPSDAADRRWALTVELMQLATWHPLGAEAVPRPSAVHVDVVLALQEVLRFRWLDVVVVDDVAHVSLTDVVQDAAHRAALGMVR
jgi:hypothetical protein